MIEPKELRREELERIRCDASLGMASTAEADRQALLAHAEALTLEEDHLQRLVIRLGKKLTGVVNAIRGEPGDLSMHSTHDAPELACKAMAVVRAAQGLRDPGTISDSLGVMAEALQSFDLYVGSDQSLAKPGVALPGWGEVCRKAEGGAQLNPIEAFIMRLTPGDDERAKDFRRMLRAALDYTAQQPKADER